MLNLQKQPNYDNLINTLMNNPSTVIPLIELGVHPIIKSEILGRKYSGIQDDIEFNMLMGYDFVKVQPGINFQTAHKKTSSVNTNQSPDRAWATEDKGLISNLEDFEKYNFPLKNEIDYSRFEIVKSSLPEGMGIIGQYGDIYTMVWELMGFETFAMSVYTDPELIKLLFEKVGNLVVSMYETMADIDEVGCFWYSDDIAYASGLMMHPDFFREYLFPFIKRIGDLAGKRGIPFIYHSDGVLFDVLDELINMGVTALHPIEPKSMDIKDLANRFGNRLSFCGGIELDMLSRGSRIEVEMETNKYIENVGKNYSWCAGSSNSIPEYVKVENYISMVKTVHEFNGNL